MAPVRHLGFSVDEIRGLLGLWHDRERPSPEVRALAQRHLTDLRTRAQQLEATMSTLEHLVSHSSSRRGSSWS